jgi:FkbM family methyltransferase
MFRLKAKDLLLDCLTALLGNTDKRVTLPVFAGPGKGLKFSFDLSRRIEAAYVVGRYDLPQLRTFAALVQPGMTVWDIGSYLGFYAAVASRRVGSSGAVVVFEPDPENMQRTRYNLALNRCENVQFVEAAIGPPIESVSLVRTPDTNSHIEGSFVGHSVTDYSARAARPTNRIDVRCMSLDQAYADPAIPNPGLIKIDIEGAECVALRHGVLMARELAPQMIVELHNPECDRAAWEFAVASDYDLLSLETNLVFTRAEEVHGSVLCTKR